MTDGDTSTVWTSDSSVQNPILVIDLREIRRIHRVVIRWGSRRPLSFGVNVNVDGGYGRSFVFGRQPSATDDEATGIVARGRFVVVGFQASANEMFEVREIEVYATETDNWTIHAMPSPQHFSGSDESQRRLTTDGDASTMWTTTGDSVGWSVFVYWYDTRTPRQVNDLRVRQVHVLWGPRHPAKYRLRFSYNTFFDVNSDRGDYVIRVPYFNAQNVTVDVLDGAGQTYDLREIEVYGIESDNMAFAKPTTASGSTSPATSSVAAVDADPLTMWKSGPSTSAVWFVVDLQYVMPVERIVTRWGPSYAARYVLYVSDDLQSFTPVYGTNSGDGGVDDFGVAPMFPRSPPYTRYVILVAPATDVGYELRELQVYYGQP